MKQGRPGTEATIYALSPTCTYSIYCYLQVKGKRKKRSVIVELAAEK